MLHESTENSFNYSEDWAWIKMSLLHISVLEETHEFLSFFVRWVFNEIKIKILWFFFSEAYNFWTAKFSVVFVEKRDVIIRSKKEQWWSAARSKRIRDFCIIGVRQICILMTEDGLVSVWFVVGARFTKEPQCAVYRCPALSSFVDELNVMISTLMHFCGT